MAFLDLAGLATFKNKIINYITGQRFAKSVNGEQADANNNINLTQVPFATNLTAEDAQKSSGLFVQRTSGGNVPIGSGQAWLTSVQGNCIKTGYVDEELSVVADPVQQETPATIEVALDKETYASEAGQSTTVFTYLSNLGVESWDINPGNYGLTITNSPIVGDSIIVSYDDDDNDYVVTINAVERVAPEPIEVMVDRDTFISARNSNWDETLVYSSSWGINLQSYGITVLNTPVNGDKIIIHYVKKVIGTITPVYPTSFVSTGWNLYNKNSNRARVVEYAYEENQGYKITGTFESIKWSATIDGTFETVENLIDAGNGYLFTPQTGYIQVVFENDADKSTICIWPTFSDWTNTPESSYAEYSESSVNLSGVMSQYFSNGLMSIGSIRDEINLNTSQTIKRIDRMENTQSNMETAIESGRSYDYDTQYIYIERETPEIQTYTLDGSYTVSDHGIEFFTNVGGPVYAEMLYGQNLKDKLRTNVLTLTSQSLTSTQQSQVRNNIAAAASDEVVKLSNSQTIGGIKTFTSVPVVQTGTSTSLTLRGKGVPNSTIALMCENATTEDGKYAENPFFSVRCYGPSTAEGTSRSNYYTRYRLPNVPTGQTASTYYSFVTTNGPAIFLVKTYSYEYTINANSSLVIAGNALGYSAISGYKGIAVYSYDTHSSSVIPYRLTPANYGTLTTVVLRNISSSQITKTLSISILFANSTLLSIG